jgi:trehalose-phosphatase
MGSVSAGIGTLLAPLREAPRRSAILSDLDGTLAPIVADPRAAAVPAPARELLEGLCGRYALVACLTGRRALDARRIAGVDGLLYVGNHGLEVLGPGDTQARPALDLEGPEEAAVGVVGALDRDALGDAGVTVEDKGPIQALHWRTSLDENRALAVARDAADRAVAVGLVPRWGRKVLELRPEAADKGAAVGRLLDGRDLRLATFGGDDVTDLDAFAALRELERSGRLDAAVAIGVDSPEAPDGLADASDVVVAGTHAYLDVLRFLAA